MKKIVLYIVPVLIICCIKIPVQPPSNGTAYFMLSEKGFIQYKMFFIDTLYRRYFLDNHTQVPEARKVNRASLQVWVNNDQTFIEMKVDRKNKYCYLGDKNGRVFKLLVQGRDYRLSDVYEGCILFDSMIVQASDIIGICMATKDNSTILKGDTSKVTLSDTVVYKKSLWILKNQNPIQTDSNFSLMWRNVYSLPEDFDVSKFRIQVLRFTEAGDTSDRVGSTLFSSILQLTDNNGNANIGVSSMYDIENNLLIIPPYYIESGVLNNEPFTNPALGRENVCPDIYRKTYEQFDEIKRKYIIKIPLPAMDK